MGSNLVAIDKREQSLKTYTNGEAGTLFSSQFLIAVSLSACETKEGQVLIHAILSQIGRLSREVGVVFPGKGPYGLKVGSLFKLTILEDECERLLTELNCERLGPDLLKNPIRVFVGFEFEQTAAGIYVGVDGNEAFVTKAFRPSKFEGKIWVSALASSLFAGAITKNLIFGDEINEKLSMGRLFLGQKEILVEPFKKDMKVLIVGFGAVGANFLYWQKLFGFDLNLHIIDGDKVEFGNTSRGLLFFFKHCVAGAEWNKVDVAKSLAPEIEVTNAFFDEHLELSGHYDLTLCLANERDVRKRITKIDSEVIFQATTGTDWISQFHRHIKGKDDCVHCRTGHLGKKSVFACSSGEVESGEKSDAAMPFLSALSSLMLLLEVVNFGAEVFGEKNSTTFGFRHKVKPDRRVHFPKGTCEDCK